MSESDMAATQETGSVPSLDELQATATEYAKQQQSELAQLQQTAGVLVNTPSLVDKADSDPSGFSATVHGLLQQQQLGRSLTPQEATAIHDSYKSIYGERPMTAGGGTSDFQQYEQKLAGNENSFAHNVAATVGPHVATYLTNPMSLFAPGIAKQIQDKANAAYGVPQEGSAGGYVGQAVNLAGDILPMLAENPAGAFGSLTPAAQSAATTTYFAGTGAGQARAEVANEREQGQNISGLDEAAYTGMQAAIQGILFHFLGKVGAGGMGQIEGGELTQSVPFQNLIRSLSPDMLKAIQGTDGAVLKPIIYRTLLNMGVAAGQSEVANTASNVAKMVTGLKTSGLFEGAGQAAISGAVFGGVGGLRGELENRGVSSGPVEEAPPESIQQMGRSGTGPETQRVSRFASEDESFLNEPTKPATPATPEPAAPAATEEAYDPDLNPGAFADHPGRQMPIEPRDEQAEQLTQAMEKQAKESDETMASMPKTPDQNTFTHPLVDQVNKGLKSDGKAPDVTHSRFQNDDQIQAADAIFKARGLTVIPVSSDTVAGFQHPDHPGTVLFNVNDPEHSYQSIIGHEWAHDFMDKFPDEAQALLDKLPAARKAQILADYPGKIAKGNENQEVFAGIIQKAIAQDPEASGSNWARLLRQEPSLWQKIKDVGSTILNSFTAGGRELNAVRKVLAHNSGIDLAGAQAGEEGRQLPRNYLNMGHKDNEDVWWKDESGELHTSTAPAHAMDRQFMEDADTYQNRGRIMHDTKEISVASRGDPSDPMTQKRAVATAKQMESKFPGYRAFVDTRGGMVPVEEVESGGRFMLHKLDNIKSVADEKEELNKNTPTYEPHMTMTVEDKLRKATLDDQWPVIKYIRGMVGKLGDPSKLSPEALVRRLGGFREAHGQQMKHGLRGLDGAEIQDKATGENLTQHWLTDPLVKSAKKLGEKWTDIMDHAHSLMVAQRTLEKAGLREKAGVSLDEPISGIGKEHAAKLGVENTGQNDVAHAKLFIQGVDNSPAKDAITEYARRLRIWGNEHVRMAVESGLMSKESAKTMLDSNEFYVNMQRVMDKEGVFSAGDFTGPYQHRFKGSNREIDNPLGNTLQSTEMIAKKAQINYTKNRILDLAKEIGEKPIETDREGKDTITTMENGKKKIYTVTPEISTAVQGWGQHIPPALGGWLSTPGRIKALGTLIRPMFRLNHFIKQTQNRLMLSENSGLRETLKMFDPDTKELLSVLGGTMGHERDFGSSSSAYLDMISKHMDKLTGENKGNFILGLPKKIWDGYQNLGEWADAANRVAEFKGSFAVGKRRGMSDLDAQTYAAWKARDIMDFSVAGSVVKQVNKIMYQPFMNAELQGWNKMYSMIRERPAMAATRIALYGLIPSMIPYFWAKHQGKDTEARYVDTPLAQRIMFNQFHVGDYRIMVPKGQTQAMASCLWEAFLDKHRGDVGTWGKAMADSGLIPRQVAGLQGLESMIPFQGMREAQSNWSWFYDRHIIPPDQEGLALDLRHTDGASGVGKFISVAAQKAGWEVDPRKIDHVLSTDLGTSGIDVQSASNVLSGRNKPLANKVAAGLGVVRLPPGYTSVSVQDAMTAAQRFKDTGSPQYKAVQDSLQKSYAATTAAERNKFVDEARASADDANEFYRKYGDQLIKVKQVSSDIAAAIAAYDSQKGLQARQEWLQANPDQAALAKQDKNLKDAQTSLSEARKVLANDKAAPFLRKRAEAQLERTLDYITKLGSGTKP